MTEWDTTIFIQKKRVYRYALRVERDEEQGNEKNIAGDTRNQNYPKAFQDASSQRPKEYRKSLVRENGSSSQTPWRKEIQRKSQSLSVNLGSRHGWSHASRRRDSRGESRRKAAHRRYETEVPARGEVQGDMPPGEKAKSGGNRGTGGECYEKAL